MGYLPLLVVIPFFVTWIFVSFKIALTTTSLLLMVLARSWPQEFKYYLKIWTFNFIFMFSTLIYLPFYFIHPFSYDNLGYILIFWKHSLRLFRIKVEPRDVEKSRIDGPAVIIANHQSSLDLLSLVHTLPPRTTILAKKEIIYLGWFGLCAYMCNIIFVDRFNHHKAVDTIARVAKIMKEEKVNVLVYPEGTRNMDGSMLPFKKGAFHLAIQAQVPIIPIVSSSYSSFLDHKAKRFDSGCRLIARCMDPVETKGLTADDVDSLIERVRNDMLKVFHEISAEVMHDYTAYDEDSNPTPAKKVPLEPLIGEEKEGGDAKNVDAEGVRSRKQDCQVRDDGDK